MKIVKNNLKKLKCRQKEEETLIFGNRVENHQNLEREKKKHWNVGPKRKKKHQNIEREKKRVNNWENVGKQQLVTGREKIRRRKENKVNNNSSYPKIKTRKE